MGEFRLVNDAVKAVKSAEEYIRVGMDMCGEVAMDFIENNPGTVL